MYHIRMFMLLNRKMVLSPSIANESTTDKNIVSSLKSDVMLQTKVVYHLSAINCRCIVAIRSNYGELQCK